MLSHTGSPPAVGIRVDNSGTAGSGMTRPPLADPGGPRGFFEAVRHVVSGSAEELASLLDAEPALVHARSTAAVVPYDGYFHGATLLHHVAGNPLIRPVSDGAPQALVALLERGAEVDAATRAGPSQPDDVGWTTLGLVATSAAARQAGVQRTLMDRLLAAGADPDARGGGTLMGALFYGESAAAEHLAASGATLDLVAASGVGRVDAMMPWLERLAAEGPAGVADGRALVHYSQVRWPDHAPPAERGRHVLGMALTYAALHGRLAALDLLLEAGADPNHRAPFQHGATPLHWAAMGDAPAAVERLLAAGADPEARDDEFESTPLGWALHLGRPRAAAVLRGPTTRA